MASEITAETQKLLTLIVNAGPSGATPDVLQKQVSDISRSTLNRRLATLVLQGAIKPVGAGRALRYLATSPFTVADIAQYLAKDWQARPIAPFKEAMLAKSPNIDPEKARRLQTLTGLASVLDKKFLSNFLIDFSWGSSVLEGGTYSDLDTQALILYGQRNPNKSVEDALLVLNHKQAIEYLWSNRTLDIANICAMHGMLTDRHNMAEVEDSDHFLPSVQRGVPREYEDVNLGRSAYLPPFRPGSGYIKKALIDIVSIANSLSAVESAFYLMTRIPYLQAFANGNKRTARLAANLPLLSHGLLPISFVDFNRAQYIQGMAAFYELNNLQIIENTFIDGYVRSIIRGSNIPPSMRATGFDIDDIANKLVYYVNSGTFPKNLRAAAFVAAQG